jgi:hypothetical protein
MQGPKTERSVLNKLKTELNSGKSFEGCTINYRKDRAEIYLKWTILEMKLLNTYYYVAAQDIYNPDEVLEWINKIKNLQEHIVQTLENI